MKIRLNVVGGTDTKSRVRVDPLPFVIGRHEECHLQLASRTVSRRHCQLELQDEQLFVRDLGSRNPTRLNNEKLEPSSPEAIWHGDLIRVGKISFRVSLRDPNTNAPILPEDRSSDADDLLTQLDTIAGMIIPDGPKFPPDSTENTTSLPGIQETVEATGTDPSETPEKASGQPSEEEPDSSNNDAIEGDSDAPVAESESSQSAPVDGFRRLPRHLRPKGSDNSQEAANDALRRLFGGR